MVVKDYTPMYAAHAGREKEIKRGGVTSKLNIIYIYRYIDIDI